MIRVTLRSGQVVAFEGDNFQIEASGNLGIFTKAKHRASVAAGEWSYVSEPTKDSEYLLELVASLDGTAFSTTDWRRVAKPFQAAKDYLGLPG